MFDTAVVDSAVTDHAVAENPDARVREFDALFEASDDPWHFRERWYEARKRALTVACLPHARYASAYEPGCANGELSAALAPRCDRLLVTDGAAAAVALAARRLAAHAHAEVVQAWTPADWPDQRFDLIVVSELAYYLDGVALDRLIEKLGRSLQPKGVLVACHWRRTIEGCALNGDALHARLADGLALPLLSSLVEADFRLDVWSADARSVGEREGLA